MHHAALLPQREGEAARRIAEAGADAPIGVGLEVGVALVEDAVADSPRFAEIQRWRIVERDVGSVTGQRDQVGAGADQGLRGNLQRPVVDQAATGQAEIRMPAEEARREVVADVLHARIQAQARVIQGELDCQVDRMRVARARTNRRGGQPHAGGRIVGSQPVEVEQRITHEAMAAGPFAAGHARVQILRYAVEAVARIGDAAGERHHDREARTGPVLHLVGIAVTVGQVVQAVAEGHLETEQGSAVQGHAHVAVSRVIVQHHDGLRAQPGTLHVVAGRAGSSHRILLRLNLPMLA